MNGPPPGFPGDPAVAVVLPPISRDAIAFAGVLAIVVLILLSAFFASSEIAIFSLGNHRISSLVEEGVSGAATLDALKSDPRRLLVTILVGNNIANIAMSSIATGLLGMYVGPTGSVLIATFGITSIVLLFGESAPKSYAVENSESWALRIARPLRIAQYLLYPLIAVFDVLTRVVNEAMGSEGDFESAYVTRAEIRDMIETGGREGVLEDEEHRMLQRILRFRNRIAKETMIPRLDVVAVDADEDVSTALATCIESGRDRLPVYEETLDEIVGVVDVLDLLAAQERGGTVAGERGETPSLRSLAREPYVIPETKRVDELLEELRAERRNVAIVVDEFGTTAGIVTIETIVEEIIGEVLAADELVPIRWVDDRTAVVRGELNVHEVNEALGTDLPETAAFETVAGLVFHRAGRIVEEGEEVAYENGRLVVETVENNRILEVRVIRSEPFPERTEEP